jgi:hypothetical protein
MLVGFCLSLSVVGAGAALARASKPNLSKYATVAQVEAAVASAQGLKAAPAKVEPNIETLANGGGFGNDMATTCPAPSVNASSVNVKNCTFGVPSSKRTLVLTGDSRAQMWFDAFDIIAKAEDLKLVFLAKSGCPAPIATYQLDNHGTFSNSAWPACSHWHTFVEKTIAKLNPAYVVVSTEESLPLANPLHYALPAEIQADMVAFLKALPPTSKAVVLGGFPEPGSAASPTLCLSKGPSVIDSCNFTPSKDVDINNGALQSAAAAAGATFINQTPWLCATTCPSVISGIIPYTVDGYHIDATYTKYLIGALWQSLEPVVTPGG